MTEVAAVLSTGPGQVLVVVLAVAIACVWSKEVRAVVRPFYRFATGGLIFAKMSPWHASFLRPAPPRPEARPNFRGESYPLTAWGRMAGWRRMLWRWGAIGYVVALATHPTITVVVTVVIGIVAIVRKLRRELEQWAHARAAGLFADGAAVLLGRTDDPLTWIGLPRLRLSWRPAVLSTWVMEATASWPAPIQYRIGALMRRLVWLDLARIPELHIPLADDEARVLVQLEATFTDTGRINELRKLGVARLPEGPWEAEYHGGRLLVEFKHPKRPPSSSTYDETVYQRFPVTEIPVGQKAGGEWVTLPIKALTPHTVMSATTGWCKTTTANVYAAHVLGHGARAFFNDPKRLSYQHLADLPTVTVRTTPEGFAENVAVFLAEMERRYQFMERYPEIKENAEKYFQPWFLLTDERGSFTSALQSWWKAKGEKGIPLPLQQEKIILWQARAAAMYVFDMCQQASLGVFGDSDGRDQRMARIASGPQSRSSWVMLFPGMPKRSTAMKKGRAFVGIGVEDITEVQLARITDEATRAFAERGVTLAETENAVRAERLSALLGPQDDAELEPMDTVQALPASPAETPASVRPADLEHGTPATEPRNHGTTETWNHGTPESRPVVIFPAQRANADIPADSEASVTDIAAPSGVPAQSKVDTPEPLPQLAPLPPAYVVGIKAAAALLGMSEEAFTKARRRRPISGEEKIGVQPAWKELDLKEWRRQAPRAGAS